ncbi:MAG: T9SS type A sorting domain-containing protein, partial [Bacteroidales bacterium]
RSSDLISALSLGDSLINILIEENSQLTNLSGVDNVRYIQNNLFIGSNTSLENIDALQTLEGVGLSVSLNFNPSLTDYNGLAKLLSIGKDLTISYNSQGIASLTGLDNLKIIGGNLELSSNYALSDISSLDNLSVINGSLKIYENPYLTSLSGLNNLNSIGGDVELNYNYSLLDLSDFNQLTKIGGNLNIEYNDQLNSLTGLELLDTINGSLSIKYNQELTDVTALGNLKAINGYIKVSGNDVLSSLTGFDHINAETISLINITGNPMLTICNAQSICAYLNLPNSSSTILYNNDGCNNLDQVNEACGVGINDNPDSEIGIYPNPAHNQLSVRSPDVMQNGVLTIFDLSGRKVLCQQIAESPVSITALNSGMFMVEIRSGSSVYRKKLIIN